MKEQLAVRTKHVVGLRLAISWCSRLQIASSLVIVLLLGSCQGNSRDISLNGEELYAAYCGSCHLLADPTDLDKSSWSEYILPRMGWRLGYYRPGDDRNTLLANHPGLSQEEQAQLYPEEALIAESEMQAISDYVLSLAPESLPATPVQSNLVDTSFPLLSTTENPPLEEVTGLSFRPIFSELFVAPPSATFVRFMDHEYLVADANKQSLYRFNADHQLTAELPVGEGMTDLEIDQAGNWFGCVIGSFSPTDEPTGRVFGPQGQTLLHNLKRPVDLALADLNQDGTNELIVAEFGKQYGRLAWWEPSAQGPVAHNLANTAGALRVIPVPNPKTGQIDIYALFGQGDERIMRYKNQGGGEFEAELLYRFPPSYGSVSMDTLDWNGDGLLDLLVVNGDNADYPPIIKPYHGIRLLQQQLDGSFEEALFLPLPGAYAARAADLDQDGDLDLAAISFFPDFSSPSPNSAVIFEQLANQQFQAYRLPASESGRWISMDLADFDGDGDLDILAGSLAFEPVPNQGQLEEWVAQGLLYLLWENTH